jgi:hypothetical protein
MAQTGQLSPLVVPFLAGAATTVVAYVVAFALGAGYEVREAWLLVLLPMLFVAGLLVALSVARRQKGTGTALAASVALGVAGISLLLALVAPGADPASQDGAPETRARVAAAIVLAAGPAFAGLQELRTGRGAVVAIGGFLLTAGATVWAWAEVMLRPTEAAAAAVAQALGLLTLLYAVLAFVILRRRRTPPGPDAAPADG